MPLWFVFSGVGQQQRGRGSREVVADRLCDKLVGTSSLLGTGSDGGPNPLTPFSSPWTTRSLGNPPIDDTETQRPLGGIVGGLNLWGGDESEVLLPMEPEALDQVGGLSSQAGSSRHGEKGIALLFKLSLKGFW